MWLLVVWGYNEKVIILRIGTRKKVMIGDRSLAGLGMVGSQGREGNDSHLSRVWEISFTVERVTAENRPWDSVQ